MAPKKESMADLPKNRRIFSRTLDDLSTRKNHRVFTVYIDEMGELADPKKMGLGTKVEVLLQQMRYRKGSVITGMQFPVWIDADQGGGAGIAIRAVERPPP